MSFLRCQSEEELDVDSDSWGGPEAMPIEVLGATCRRRPLMWSPRFFLAGWLGLRAALLLCGASRRQGERATQTNNKIQYDSWLFRCALIQHRAPVASAWLDP